MYILLTIQRRACSKIGLLAIDLKISVFINNKMGAREKILSLLIIIDAILSKTIKKVNQCKGQNYCHIYIRTYVFCAIVKTRKNGCGKKSDGDVKNKLHLR